MFFKKNKESEKIVYKITQVEDYFFVSKNDKVWQQGFTSYLGAKAFLTFMKEGFYLNKGKVVYWEEE